MDGQNMDLATLNDCVIWAEKSRSIILITENTTYNVDT